MNNKIKRILFVLLIVLISSVSFMIGQRFPLTSQENLLEKQGEFSSEDKSYIVTIPLENSGDGFLYQYSKDNQLEQKHGKYEKISDSLARLTSTDETIFYLFETVEDLKQGVMLVDETNKNEVFLVKTGNSYVVIEEE